MSSYQIIKLKNGEDLICNVLDNENGRLKVTTPLKMETVNRISKKGLTESLALTRWIQPYSDEEHFFKERNSIILMAPASVGMSRYYEYVVKSYDGLVLKEAKEETVEKIKIEKQKSSKLQVDDDLTESLALTRWIQPYSDEDHFFIESNSIIIMTPASIGMTRYYEYVLKSYDGLVLKSAKEEVIEKVKTEKQKSSKLEIDDDMLESDLKDYLFSDKKTIH